MVKLKVTSASAPKMKQKQENALHEQNLRFFFMQIKNPSPEKSYKGEITNLV